MARQDPLPEKYRKALSLLEDGNSSYGEIADKCGIPRETLYDLIEGRCDDYGTIGDKFTASLNEINKRRDKEIRDLLKKNKKGILYIIDKWICDNKNLKNHNKVMSTVTAVANALSKSTPNVEIGSFVYQKGLSAEDIYGEFKRLTAIASDRGPVQGTPEGRTGEVPLAPRSRVAVAEESEDTIL
jgi:predicted DNA-binding protein YlxM (UPF0122 family)